jgi:hypothetical protein
MTRHPKPPPAVSLPVRATHHGRPLPPAWPSAASHAPAAAPRDLCAWPLPVLRGAPWPAGYASGGARTAAEPSRLGIARVWLELAGRRPALTCPHALAASDFFLQKMLVKVSCKNWCNILQKISRKMSQNVDFFLEKVLSNISKKYCNIFKILTKNSWWTIISLKMLEHFWKSRKNPK